MTLKKKGIQEWKAGGAPADRRSSPPLDAREWTVMVFENPFKTSSDRFEDRFFLYSWFTVAVIE